MKRKSSSSFFKCGPSVIGVGEGAEDIALTSSGHVLITSGLSWPVLNHNPRPGAVFSLDTNNPQSMLESVHFLNMTSVSIFELV